MTLGFSRSSMGLRSVTKETLSKHLEKRINFGSEYARPSEPLDNLLQQVVVLSGNGNRDCLVLNVWLFGFSAGNFQFVVSLCGKENLGRQTDG